MFKYSPIKNKGDFTKAIQERFKARTPKGRQDHYLRITDTLTGFTQPIPFTNKSVALDIMKRINKSSPNPPEMEVVSKPKLEEGEYISS